ncbi:uncharacterized protein TM35_000014410 [Trypanosoma theileri]|uniref:C2CD3 N-terminal C2 domain-containing protein n=1 Tax=Trypanosoma theileri TaxID=67003 RepID=A0A1X0P9G3_9TRYP|nr:uncharacterized protein TM35_000014410 [Trypanosoma theileri]ORC93564.1 hypothetical protein TM35_000014410 [Trypanosoma theileri]
MRLVYGSSLPPGVEASTRGELRIRVEKLLLKDGLVHTSVSSSVSTAGPRPYTIPVDECAVSALFWGEQQSSSHCIPATPGKPRGTVSLVFPVKTYEQQFSSYLAHMSNSTQKGLQLSVFVPTSYSGRHKPVSVGKIIIALDTLKPSIPISGWFAVVSNEVRSMDAVKESEGSQTKEEEFIEVGKLKLTFTLTFFTRAMQSPTSHKTRSVSVNSYEKSGRSQSREGRFLKDPNTSRTTSLVNPEITVFMDTTQGPLEEQEQKLLSPPKESIGTSPITNTNTTTTCMRESKYYPSSPSPTQRESTTRSKSAQDPLQGTLPYASVTPTMGLNQQNVIGQLIQKGLGLREKMSKALRPFSASENLSYSTRQPLTLSSPTTLKTVPNYIPTTLPAEHLINKIPISTDPLESSVSSANDESLESKTDDDDDDDEDNEDGGMKMKRRTFSKEPKGYSIDEMERHSFQTPFKPSGLNPNENAYVEVDISKIAFSSGRATLGMEEMRVGIRLSKDVKTDEPVESYSSYVHRVPLARGANHHIIIGFPIRSFSKDKSRMVISFYRVRSAPVANPPGELLLPPPASAQRVLVDETLLGMCIVGLHDQSRDVVLHDPITGEDPTQAYIHVSLRNSEIQQLSEEQRGSENLGEKNMQQEQRNMKGRGKNENKVLHNRKGHMDSIDTSKEHYRSNLLSQSQSQKKKRKHHLRSHSSSSSSSASTPESSSCSSEDSSPLLSPSGDGTQEGKKKRVNGIIPNSNNLSISPPLSLSATAATATAAGGNNDVNLYTAVTAVPAATAADDNDNNNNNNNDIIRSQENGPVRCNLSTVDNGNFGMNAEKHARLVDAHTNTLPTVTKVEDENLSDRFRMHVSIRAGKELPMVTVSQNGSPLLSTVAAIDHFDNGVRSAVTSDGRLVLVDSEHRVFQPPTTFFVIEDIYSGADSRLASKGVVPDWFVEAAVRGEYDRTSIVPQSQSPQFDYECILSLPWESVFLRQAPKKSKGVVGADNNISLLPEGSTSPLTCVTTATSTSTKSATSTTTTATTLCLQEMRLTLWHAVGDANKKVSSLNTDEKEEEKFWARTALLGECRVDLRSLRFLKVLDGWYRINAIDRVDEVVGYVRVSVRLL